MALDVHCESCDQRIQLDAETLARVPLRFFCPLCGHPHGLVESRSTPLYAVPQRQARYLGGTPPDGQELRLFALPENDWEAIERPRPAPRPQSTETAPDPIALVELRAAAPRRDPTPAAPAADPAPAEAPPDPPAPRAPSAQLVMITPEILSFADEQPPETAIAMPLAMPLAAPQAPGRARRRAAWILGGGALLLGAALVLVLVARPRPAIETLAPAQHAAPQQAARRQAAPDAAPLAQTPAPRPAPAGSRRDVPLQLRGPSSAPIAAKAKPAKRTRLKGKKLRARRKNGAALQVPTDAR